MSRIESKDLNMSTGMSYTAPRLAWQVLYQAALLETDPNKMPERIADAEKAILSRIQELFVTSADHIEEDVVLDDALYGLRALRNCVVTEVTAA
jgi:hypothetical protein